MGQSLALSLKALFQLLACLMLALSVYTVFAYGLPFNSDIYTPWMVATIIDYYINIVAFGAWIFYKESNCTAIVWILLLVVLQSYIALQFFKLSPQDSSQDPIFHVLLGHQKKDGVEQKRNYSVVNARFLFGTLGCLMLAIVVYTLITDGSPFHSELLTPWMLAFLIGFYINVLALSIWVAYKESSWISTFVWIVLLICLGSIATCAYIVRELFQLSTQDPVFLVLFNRKNRAENRYETTIYQENGMVS